VLPWHDAFLTLTFLAPNEAWTELEPDFASVLRSVELDKDGVQPTLQGPAQKGPPKPASRPPVLPGKKVVPAPAPVPLDDGMPPPKPRRGRH